VECVTEKSRYGGTGFDEFIGAESPRLWRLAYTLCRNKDDAADLVQETLVRTGLRWGQVQQSGNPGAYARTALVRVHINRSRRERLLRSRIGLMVGTPEINPSAVVELSDQVAFVLRHLPPRQRATMTLFYLEDLPISDIAAILRCSEGTVKSQLAKGRRSARETLGAHLEGVHKTAASVPE
jgi:RNA polymerase sigma factor (sigma-70 family)